MNTEAPSPAVRAGARSHRTALAALAALSVALAWFWMGQLASNSSWYHNANMDAHNVIDALALNSGYSLGTVDQPAAPTKFLLALDFRVRNTLGLQPVWTLKRLARSADPVAELAGLIRIGRTHSRVLTIVFILVTAACVGQITRRFDAACLAAILLSGSAGLLVHGMLVRPELLCAFFGGVLAFQAAWIATRATHPGRRTLWLFTAGLLGGLAVLSKLPAPFYLIVIFLWSAVAAVVPSPGGSTADPTPHSRTWSSILCPVVALATLALLLLMAPQLETVAPLALARLRLVAVAVALLPLLAFVPTRHRTSSYVIERILDAAILGGGFLASFIGALGLLGMVMPFPLAVTYLAKIGQMTFQPEPLLNLYTQPGYAHQLGEALRYLVDRPALIGLTGLFALGLVFCRHVAPRSRAVVIVLWVQALGMLLLASKRGFLPQFHVWFEVPLLVIWCVGLPALHAWWCETRPATEQRWPAALAITAAFILILTMPLRLSPQYHSAASDDGRSPSGLTITFLYDHDAHPPAYLAAIKARYPDRAAFEAALHRHLAVPPQATERSP